MIRLRIAALIYLLFISFAINAGEGGLVITNSEEVKNKLSRLLLF